METNQVNVLLMDTDEAARVLGVCSKTIRDWSKAGELRPIKLGRRCVRFSVAELQRFIATKQAESSPE